MDCDPELWRFLAAQNVSLECVIPDVLAAPGHRMHGRMHALHSSVSPDHVASVQGDAMFQLRFERHDKQRREYWARVVAIDTELGREFDAHRVRVLRAQRTSRRPPPYDHPSLSHLRFDDEFLVQLDTGNHDGSFTIGNVVCQATLTTPSPNSMYWALWELGHLCCERKIRLDPLLVCPADEYHEVGYRMTVYAAPLDWQQLRDLREPLQARWIPDQGTREDVAFTEAVWTPRDDGVHFQCEEVPPVELADVRGARYFHSIYDPASETFVHTDGALRLYSQQELSDRHHVHLRRGGKMGARAKVFAANGRIDRDAWCRLASAFFVWNDDVQGYFGGRGRPLVSG